MSETGSAQRKFIELSNGLKMPRIGLGTSKGQEYAVRDAINAGYRHVDTAMAYGNEEEIGKVLKEIFSEGTVKREDLFITTKIWVDETHDVEKALKGSLERLQLDYVDLYLIHWPVGVVDTATGKIKRQVPLHLTWKALENQVKAGRTRSIGVSNFNVQILLDLLSYAEIKPVCNQIELHPYFTQEDLVKFCQKNDIEVVAYSPLGGNNPENPEFTAKTMVEEPVIKEIAAKYNRPASQIILNWHLSRGYTVIPRSANQDRIKENIECFSFELSPEDAQKISALNKNAKVWDLKNFESFGIPMFA